MSTTEIQNELTTAEAIASNEPTNPGAEPAVRARNLPKTRDEKVARIDEQIAALQARRQSILDAPEVQPKQAKAPVEVNVGETITFKAGRGETRRTLTGQVLAVYEKAGARKVKVLAGEGADAQLLEVFASSIEQPGAEVDPLASAE